MARSSHENLADLALFIAQPVADAVRSQLVMWGAEEWFDGQPEAKARFRTHPTNTLAYRALGALERSSFVHVAETLKDEHKIFATDAPIRGRVELALHRDAISHPATICWRRDDRQAFADADRTWTDIRAGILWDVQKSVNEALRKEGQRGHNETIHVTLEMATVLHSILQLACGDGYAPPSAADLLGWLQGREPHYFALLDSHPSG